MEIASKEAQSSATLVILARLFKRLSRDSEAIFKSLKKIFLQTMLKFVWCLT